MCQTASLKGKVAIITGASSGIGTAIARRLASDGCAVVVSARRAERLNALASELTAAGGQALAVPADVSDAQQMQALADQTVAEFGRIDIMVNNAGFGFIKPFMESTLAEINSQIDVNFKGVCFGSMAVLPTMDKQQSGTIINIGSIASIRHWSHLAVYAAAKHAVLGFSRSLYEEVRTKGIRVSVICPAAVNTEFLDVAGLTNPPWPAADMIQSEDVAELVMTCINMPKNVSLDTMVLWPTCQSSQ
jgi:NADP-dependent 3-hydroxy acid dehydrogenase YdfG